MDDVHFILRHAMTGAVFVIFSGIGLFAFGIDASHLWPKESVGDGPGTFLALTVIAFPMIGITIQGAHYCIYTVFLAKWFKDPEKAEWFQDPARRYIAKTV